MYKTASHFFQRFKESTGKNAFNLWFPVRERPRANQNFREALSSGSVYSPLLRTLLRETSLSRRNILIISPYLKLSLVRPFLLALPRRDIEVQLLTKFEVKDFRFSSDLRAIELLLHRPAVPGRTRIFNMGSWHDPVFIFDGETVISERRSINNRRGFSKAKNYRKDRILAQQIVSRVKAQLSARGEIHNSAVEAMRSRVFSETSVFDFGAVMTESDVIKLNAAPFGGSDDIPHVQIQESLDELFSRDLEIQEFVDGLQDQTTNTISGIPFESPSMSREEPELLLEAARRDIERIRTLSRTSLGLESKDAEPDALVTPFVHKSWCNWARMEEFSSGLQDQFFYQLGKQIIHLEVALHFTAQLSHDAATAAPASIATHGSIPYLDYLTPLESNGLNVILSKEQAGLAKQWARDQFEAIVGLLCFYRNHDVAREFVSNSIKDDLASQQVMEVPADFKTLLQNFAQLDKQTPQYLTERVAGEDHEAIFSSKVILGKVVFEGAIGARKKEAESNAAKNAMSQIMSEARNRGKYDRAVRLTLGSGKVPVSKYSLTAKRRDDCLLLSRLIGLHDPKQVHLLDLALTHTSWVHEHPDTRSYLRLAFIGSLITDILLLEDCIRTHGWRVPGPAKDNYQSSRHRLVSVLSKAFDSLQLGRYVRAASTAKSMPASIKNDVIQSIFAAAFLQGNLKAARLIWDKWIRPVISAEGETASNIDAITTLQEITQAKYFSRPEYEAERDPATPGHRQQFKAICRVNGLVLGRGRGQSKKDAKQMAARQALNQHSQERRPQQIIHF